MPTGSITKRAIDALQPADKPVMLWDEEVKGFGCKVTTGGRKVYVYQYRLGGRAGRTIRTEIGTHGSITPDQARARAKELRGAVDGGIDPVAARRAAAEAEAAAARAAAEAARLTSELRIDTLANRFLAESIKPSSPGSYEFCEGTLRLHIVPVIGDVALPQLGRADTNRMLAKIPVEKAALRRNAFAVLRWLAAWATEALDLETNPMAGIKPPPMVKARDRVLTDGELVLVWRAAGEESGPFRALYRLLIATGQRREEVAALDWRELDRATKTWTLPAARAKNDEASIVPLNELAIAELDLRADGEKWPRRGLVLSTTGQTAISGFSRAKDRLDRTMLKLARDDAEEAGDDVDEIVLAPWRVHDLRRTLATGMQRLGVRFEVTEAILNHVSGSRSGVAGVYQRHGWTEEKRAALEAWGRHVAGLLQPLAEESNVVPISSAKA
jgi:integrase